MPAESELRMTVRTALDVSVPDLDLRVIRSRAASVRPRRSRIGLLVLAALLVPAATFAYAQRDGIRTAIIGVFQSTGGPIVVRRDTRGSDRISMHSVSILGPQTGDLGLMLYRTYANTMGLSLKALDGIPSQAHFESAMVIMRPDTALLLEYFVGKHGHLGLVIGRADAALIKAMALSIHDNGSLLRFSTTGMPAAQMYGTCACGPAGSVIGRELIAKSFVIGAPHRKLAAGTLPRRTIVASPRGLYRTWRVGSLRFILTTDAKGILSDRELTAIEWQSIVAQGSGHSGKQ